VVFPIFLGIALAVFAGIIAVRGRLLLVARPVGRWDRIGERLWRTVVYGLGQRKFLTGEQPSGVMHALVFWGFVVLMLQVATLFGRAFDADWNIPGFGPDEVLGPPFFLTRDLLEATVIVAVTYMLYRRVILHVPRLFGIGRAENRYRDAPRSDGGSTTSRCWHFCACCRSPSISTSSPRSRTCSSPSSRRAPSTGHWQ
jgi:hypothetical protein